MEKEDQIMVRNQRLIEESNSPFLARLSLTDVLDPMLFVGIADFNVALLTVGFIVAATSDFTRL